MNLNTIPLQMIDLENISIVADNRENITDASVGELRDSMRQHGLLQPILVQAAEEADVYYLVAGERRYRAAKLLNWETIQAKVLPSKLPSDELHGIRLVENLQREGLTPWEEAKQLAALQATRPTFRVEQVADWVGRSPSWVAQRLAINKLVPELREYLKERDWPLSHLPIIARLPVEYQPQALVLIQTKEAAPWRNSTQPLTLRELQEILNDFARNLKEAKWRKDDAKLLPAAGACSTCPKRSSAQALLFPEVAKSKEDFCLDRTCWEKKEAALVQVSVDKLAKKKAPAVIYATRYGWEPAPEVNQVIGNNDVIDVMDLQEVKEGTKGARPAVMVSGDELGKVMWVKERPKAETAPSRRQIDQETGKPKPPSNADRLKALEQKRKCRAVELWAERLEGMVPDFHDVVAIVSVFGTNGTHTYLHGSKGWPEVDASRNYSDNDRARILWETVQHVMHARCKRTGTLEQGEELWNEVIHQARELHHESVLEKCWAGAVMDVPLPVMLKKANVADPYADGSMPGTAKKKGKGAA